MHITPNGWVYVGVTSQNVNKRWQNGGRYNCNEEFYAAIKKYGWDNIKHEVLEAGISGDEAYAMERFLIAKYREIGKCYNISSGGNGGGFGVVHTEKSKQKMSAWNKGNQEHMERIRQIGLSHSKAVAQYTKTKNFVANFASALEAERNTGVSHQNISGCCNGKRKTAGGFMWGFMHDSKFEDEGKLIDYGG